jgi:HEAT repeat protein
MSLPEAVTSMVLDQLRQHAATIGDSQARQAWLKSVEKLKSLQLTTKHALRLSLRGLAGDVSLACWALGNLRDEDAVPDLLNVLRRGDQFSFEAAKALRTIGDERSAPALIEVLTADASLVARLASAYALAAFGQPEIEKALSAALADQHEPSELRAACAEALGYGHYKGALPALAAATGDSSPEVRYWSLYALGELGEPEALRYVAARLTDTEQASTGEPVAEEAKRVYEMLVRRGATG